MFNRKPGTYDIDEAVIVAILQDEANPLKRIVDLIPDNVKVLDIGAGNGVLARIIGKTRNAVIVDGIEPEPYAASMASQYYRNFHTGYLQDFAEVIREETYDFVVLADVIEHIPDPILFLHNLLSSLTDRTKIVLSIPNIAFGAVRIALLDGNFDYVDSGLLERTHLRFFTLKTINELARNLDLNVEKLYFLRRDLFSSEIKLPGVGICCLSEIIRDDLAWVYQFLVVLTKDQVNTDVRNYGEIPEYPLLHHLISRFGTFLGKEPSR